MTPETFVNRFNLHDSIINTVTIESNGTVIRMVIDFAFWMQEDYREEHAETGPLAVSFYDVTEYESPDQLPVMSIIFRTFDQGTPKRNCQMIFLDFRSQSRGKPIVATALAA